MLIEPNHPDISISRQCDLVGLPRSSLYYASRGESQENLGLMRLLDEAYTRWPFYGVRRMTAWLRRQAKGVNPKRVRRLMRQMGLEAIYPKRRLSLPEKGDLRYPYLLRGVVVARVDQVWSADITYIGLECGFAYLVAIMDWFSRYVVCWRLSGSLEGEFCVGALEEALGLGVPEIFNTDQGRQFTSEAFTGLLERSGIRVSMDGRGRVFDNIFVERLWRTVKYEEVYLKDYAGFEEARLNLGVYFRFYNQERLHSALAYRTPAEVYFGGREEWGRGWVSADAMAATPVALRAPSVAAISGG